MEKHYWRLEFEQNEIQSFGPLARAYGTYQVFVDGHPVNDLRGHFCRALTNRGRNGRARSGQILQGEFPLWTQFGRYSSIGFSSSANAGKRGPYPGLMIGDTKSRGGILLHPAQSSNLYVSDEGGITLTKPTKKSQLMDSADTASRIVRILESLQAFSPAAFEREVTTKLRGASVIFNSPTIRPPAKPKSQKASPATRAEPSSLPISRNAAVQCARWLMENYGPQLQAAVVGKQYRVKHLCAIVCQETAYKWLNWVDRLTPLEILARCVFDASGDYPGAPRSAFPKDTAAFRARYDDSFSDMLIEEANKTRRLQNLSDKDWIYKGYGIFQYDLQHVISDEAFFRDRQWGKFAICLRKCCEELDAKLVSSGGDLWKAIRMYNGSGASAERYRENVRAFSTYCEAVTGE